MEHLWIGIAGVIAFLLLLGAGVYIAVAVGLVGAVGLILVIGFGPATGLLATTLFHYGTSYSFIVAPLFIAMGLFASEAGVSANLYDTLSKWFGGIRGGMGLATVAACTMFGTLTGSSIATAMVFAKVSVPEMRRHGYNDRVAYGLVCVSGALGMLIPPSVLAVIYAVLTEESVGLLLLGGIGPGIILALCLGIGFVILLTLRPSLGPTARERISWRERLHALPKVWPAMVVGTIVIGGIYLGVFTVIEAAGIGAFVLFVLRSLAMGFSRKSGQMLLECLRETVSLTAMILIIMCAANVFGRFLVLSGVGPWVTDSIIGLNLPAWGFVTTLAIFSLMLGTILDSISIVAIIIPLVYPAVIATGIDFIWFAMVMILSVEIGLVTPPVGLIIYAVKGIAGTEITLEDLFRAIAPFFLMMLIALGIIIAFPIISTWIPYHALPRR